MKIDNLEYNIIAYLQTIEDAEWLPFAVGGYDDRSPAEQIIISISGGEKQNDAYSLARPMLQFLIKSKSSEKAKRQIFSIFNVLDNKFGLELPEYDDGHYLFEAVTIPQISSMQIPSYIGCDQNYMYTWTVNFVLTGVLN